MLYGSYTLDIDSNDVGSCVFAQDHALGSDERAKEYGRPLCTAVSIVAIPTHRCDRYVVSRITLTEPKAA